MDGPLSLPTNCLEKISAGPNHFQPPMAQPFPELIKQEVRIMVSSDQKKKNNGILSPKKSKNGTLLNIKVRTQLAWWETN